MSQFVYQPLVEKKNEIRLLTLLPSPLGAELEPVECRLEHVALSEQIQDPERGVTEQSIRKNGDSPHFAALSYEWGQYQAENVARVLVNGHSIPVTMNLYIALRRVQEIQAQEQTWPRRLWVDALCINQGDTKERNHQVSRMKSIYSLATMVICCITPTPTRKFDGGHIKFPDSGWGESLDRAIPFEIAGSIEYANSIGIPDSVASLLQKGRGALQENSSNLYALFLSSYWSRLWVVQETALGSDCAKIVTLKGFLDFKQVSDAAQRLWNIHVKDPEALRYCLGRESAAALSSRCNHILNIAWAGHMLRDNPKLLYAEPTWCIDIAQDTMASDPRDKVYGLLSLMSPQLVSRLSLDYDRHPEDILTDFVGTNAMVMKSLAALPQSPSPLRSGLRPSWVPDVSGPDNVSYFRNDCNAAELLEPEISYTAGSTRIYTKGLVVDIITALAAPYGRVNPTLLPRDLASRHLPSRHLTSDAPVTTVTNSLVEALFSEQDTEIQSACRLPSRDALEALELTNSDARQVLDYYRKLADFQFADRSLTAVWDEASGEGDLGPKECVKAIGTINNVMYKRRLASTLDGRLALVPTYVQPGDCICVLSALRELAVLREGSGTWTWVGTAYVPGLMQSEATKYMKGQLQEFVLA